MTFKKEIEKRVLVLDGAMGTMVQNLGLEDSAFGGPEFKMLTDLLIFSRPDALENIHLKYLQAGADIIETNTFGASPLRLKEFDFSTIDPTGLQAVPESLDLTQCDYEALTRHLNLEGARIARRAADRYRSLPEYDGRAVFVAGSIGPSNYVLSSTQANLKQAAFAQIVDNFRLQAAGLIEGGADLLLFETQQDILELKAAILGARKAFEEQNRSLPIMVQVTVDAFSKMQIFNTDIHAAYTAVAGMGIDTFGINCNVGPDQMTATVEKLSRFCGHPISVVPNAGQPISVDGRTCYKLDPDPMAETLESFVRDHGVSIVGGCCGTTPAHIAALKARVQTSVPAAGEPNRMVYVSGPQEAVPLDSSKGLVRIGERLNVRGSKKVREAVETGDGLKMDTLEEVVSEQVKDLGIDIIDVCMDSNIVETEKVLPQIIHQLTSDFKGVMCIDSFSVEALKTAIEVYPGRPIINSISLEEYQDGQSKLDAVLSLTHGHCPVYIALVNGPKGPGQTADEKYDLAVEIVKQAGEKYGVTPDQILIDVNAYPIGSESVEGLNFCAETLACLPRIKAIHPGLKTSIGVGNLTNGLAQKPYMRKVLTSVFLDEARRAGLDCAILNPNHYVPLESLTQHDVDLARKVILHRDMEAFEELEQIALTKKTGTVQKKTDYAGLTPEESICQKIKDGFKQKEEGSVEKDGGTFPYRDRIVLEVARILDKHAPLDFIGDYLMKTMRELGDGFGRGEVSLPHLLKSADVMRNVMEFLEAVMRMKSGVLPGEAINYKGVVVLGTVYQDVHSIGKDLAKTLLENYGYRVIDLGVQVPLDRFIETARKEKADAIGMSALLVQTSNHMITVARMLKEQSFEIPILIGGAPVNHRHAGYVAMYGQGDTERILNNVFYCESGMDGVNTMNRLKEEKDLPELLESNRERLLREYQRAKGFLENRDQLLETLPRRIVGFKNHAVPSDGYGIHKVAFKLNKLSRNLDVKSLFSLNWKFGKKSSWKQKGVTLEQLQALEKEWIEKAGEKGWIRPQARFALLPAQSENDDVIVYDPDDCKKEIARIHFTPCIGKGRKDKFSIAQYFYPKSSGRMDVIGMQITTSGAAAEQAIAEFKRQNDSESALFLQGLCDRVTEDLAEYIHQLLRERAGLKKEKYGQRYSPGYPALVDLIHNKIIWETLHAEDIGVKLTGSNEFDPPSTTAAVICFHREAGYS
ncbi:MAG: homocysteine S-methyltransferase family protein [Nitrospinaceae bacterium]